jgi:glycine/D-amino acid oxidase-like deaminating enzyme
MRRPTVHIIGAGVAGLAAAVKLSSAPASIVVHEGARQAGGRCRSFFDETINATIDNGNHLLLSGNRSALAYLDAIGARKELKGPDRCEIDFADMATNERWTLRPNEGLLPWWIFVEGRRTPGVKVAEYFGAARLLWAARNARFSDAVSCSGRLYERLWRPFFLAALNTDPKDGSAALALTLLRETFARGGRACHPLVAAHGLSRAFVDPALRLLQKRGAQIRFERRTRFGCCRGGRRRHPGDAFAYRCFARAGSFDATEDERDSQRPFPHRAAQRYAADHRRRQWHRRMDFRLFGSPVDHD